MEVKLEAGAAVDLATKDDLRNQTDTIGDLFARHAKRDATVRPLAGSIGDGSTLSTSVLTFCDLGTPSVGKTWDATIVGIQKVGTPLTAVATPWAVYVTPNPNAPEPTSLVAAGTALPGATTFGKGNCLLRNGEHLVVAVLGKAAGDVYGVGARVNEINSADLPEGLKH